MRHDIWHLKRAPGTSKMALSGRPLFLHTFFAFFIHFHFFFIFLILILILILALLGVPG